MQRISKIPSDSPAKDREGSSRSSTDPSHDPCPSKSLDSFYINFNNNRYLFIYLSFIEYLLIPLNFLLLLEIQLSNDVFVNSYNISDRNLHQRFRFRRGVCSYPYTGKPLVQLQTLTSSGLIKLCLITIFFSFSFHPTANLTAVFSYLNSSHEAITSSHPQTEVPFLGDFNVYQKQWFKSSHKKGGRLKSTPFPFSRIWSKLSTTILFFQTVLTTLPTLLPFAAFFFFFFLTMLHMRGLSLCST